MIQLDSGVFVILMFEPALRSQVILIKVPVLPPEIWWENFSIIMLGLQLLLLHDLVGFCLRFFRVISMEVSNIYYLMDRQIFRCLSDSFGV